MTYTVSGSTDSLKEEILGNLKVDSSSTSSCAGEGGTVLHGEDHNGEQVDKTDSLDDGSPTPQRTRDKSLSDREDSNISSDTSPFEFSRGRDSYSLSNEELEDEGG